GCERSSVERRLVARGPGVERSTYVLDRLGNGAGIAAARALEHHMLDQMGEAALAQWLGARADEGMQADGRRLGARHGIDGDNEPIGEAGEVNPCAPPSPTPGGARERKIHT